MNKRIRYAIPITLLFGVSAYLATPYAAKKVLLRELDQRGWSASVQRVSLTSSGVKLDELDMTSRDGSKHVTLSRAMVELDASLRPKRVTANGGQVTIRGPWHGSSSKSSGRVSLELHNLPLSWQNADGSGASVEAKSMSASIGDGMEVSLNGLSVKSKWGSAEAEQAHLTRRAGKTEVGASDLSVTAKGERLRLVDLVATNISVQERAISLSASAKEASLPGDLAAQGLEATLSAELTNPGVRVQIHAGVRSVAGKHGAISADSVALATASVDGVIEARAADDWFLTADVAVGQVLVKVAGGRSPNGWKASANMEWTPCTNVLEAIPSSMKRELAGLQLDGDIRGSIGLVEADGQTPEVSFELGNKCRVTRSPDQVAAALAGKSFTRTVYSAAGKPTDKSVTIGWAGWTPLSAISPYMAKAVVTTEDPGFWGHKGVDVEAVRNSIRDNIKDRKFTRGASTITMQLAKNLFLSREKTAARKVQEFFLVMVLEQRLTKDRILEAYLNVIEFGPDVWGIGQASHHYFGVEPSRLSLAQSVFLASILPRPRAIYFGTDNKLHEARRSYVNLLLDLMLRRGSITDEECRMGKEESLVFGSPVSETGAVDATEWTVQ